MIVQVMLPNARGGHPGPAEWRVLPVGDVPWMDVPMPDGMTAFNCFIEIADGTPDEDAIGAAVFIATGQYLLHYQRDGEPAWGKYALYLLAMWATLEKRYEDVDTLLHSLGEEEADELMDAARRLGSASCERWLALRQ